jgi:hypothetical protein
MKYLHITRRCFNKNAYRCVRIIKQEVWTTILHLIITITGNLKRIPTDVRKNMKVAVFGMTCQLPPTLICLLPGPAACLLHSRTRPLVKLLVEGEKEERRRRRGGENF